MYSEIRGYANGRDIYIYQALEPRPPALGPRDLVAGENPLRREPAEDDIEEGKSPTPYNTE